MAAVSRDDIAAALTAERFGKPKDELSQPRPPAADACANGPTATYAEWVQQRTCTDKRSYPELIQARMAVLKLWRNGMTAHEYRCPYGDDEHWHVTTQTGGGEESSTAATKAEDPKRTPAGREALQVKTSPPPHNKEKTA